MISTEKKQEALKYSMDTIKYICQEIGPRESGMENEKKAQEFLQNELLENGWADESKIDEFTISRHALVGFTKIIGVMLILASLLQALRFTKNEKIMLAASIMSLSLVLLSLAILVFEFVLYRKFIDWALPRSQSRNVYAKYKATGEVKRRIVLCGHTDSAYEWPLMKIHQLVMVVVLVADLLISLVSFGLYISNIARGGSIPLYSFIITSIAGLLFISLFFVCSFRHVVPGANDNLSGVMTAVTALKCLKESDIRFENTEVAVLLTGAEEAGLRGAEAWAKKYKEEINEVETAVIAFDTLRDFDWATIVKRDMTAIIKNSPKVVNLLEKASKKAGYEVKTGVIPFGASDAAALSRAKVEAASLVAQNQEGTDYYHNRRDTEDNMCEKTMMLGLDIALAAIEIFDKEGM